MAKYAPPGAQKTFRALFISHGDRDHVNLLEHALPTTDYRFQNLVYSGDDSKYSAKTAKYIKDVISDGATVFPASASKLPYSTPRNSFEPSLTCGSLPNNGVSILTMNASPERNEGSIVLGLQVWNFKSILPADAESETYRAIYDFYGYLGDWKNIPRPDSTDLNVDLLVSAHHGSSTLGSNDGKWIYMTNPKTVVFSAGPHNGYVHPRCDTVDDYDKNSEWRTENEDIEKSCDPLKPACATFFGNRARYLSRILPSPAHTLTCGKANKSWNPESYSSALLSTRDAGTIQVSVDPFGNPSYFCPSSRVTIPADQSCFHPKTY
ncbi:MAG: hypothetical protein ING60_16085 [Rhodocyclaceae bacterium]|nr:hypothetical protein [Rhodocyclaceae bacterium]MCA3061329.1 hypothetical protein [Rhodocyclaceae bacterium]